MPIIQNDENYLTAFLNCSPNIQKFLRALNDRDSRIKWARLERDGCKMSDGSYFRVISSLRSAKEQIEEYKKGRSMLVSKSDLLLLPNKYCSSTPAWKYELVSKGVVSDKSKVSTNAWAGNSFHNWGLAVDICIRKFGQSSMIKVSDGIISLANYFSLVGITKLAEDCGLTWGGSWEDFPDVVHFEDRNYSIPPIEYHYDKNMTFEFIKRLYSLNGVSSSGAGVTSGGFFSSLKTIGTLGFLGVLAYILGSNKGGKRK